jgi:hypothetical protein
MKKSNMEVLHDIIEDFLDFFKETLQLIFKTKARGFIFTLGLSYGLACYLSNMQVLEIVKNIKLLIGL